MFRVEHTPFDLPPSNITANLPPSRPSRKPRKWIVLFPLLMVLIGGGVFGALILQKQNELRAREEKLAALRQDIKKIVLQDNALVLEMLDDGALNHITYAEFFKRANKNKEERDVLIRNLRATETGPYGEQVGNFVKLMETENEWVRAEEAVSRANLDISGKWDFYKSATDQIQEAVGTVSKARRDYEAAPYGEDYAETTALNYARSRLDSASESSKSAFDEWKKASDAAKEKKRSAAVVVADWMRNEPLYYPNFAPKRAVIALLIKKKADYISDEASSVETPRNVSQNVPSGTIKTSIEESSTENDAQPKPSPTPVFPTRVHSVKPLDGERFPATRTDEITSDYTYNLSNDDLRYAINEMFARFGMTFRNKNLQANFEGKSWYQPDDRWTPSQIKRAMTARERANLDVLTAERSARNSRDDG